MYRDSNEDKIKNDLDFQIPIYHLLFNHKITIRIISEIKVKSIRVLAYLVINTTKYKMINYIIEF